MQKLYTVGTWVVKPGMESKFIDLWTEFAKWTSAEVPGAETGFLLQDENQASKFISYGSWPDNNTIQQWRSSLEFQTFVLAVKELCDDFQPNTLRLVSSS